MDKNNMKFSEYFQEWLYGKEGYYANYKVIGKEGDFYTAVSSSKFFGGSIGKRVVDTINEGFLPKDTTVVEIGAHHGYLLSDMIQFIFTLKPELIGTLKFAIVERYEHLRIKQKEYFQKCFGDDIQLIHYNDISQLQLDNAFVVANEIFDAFPCELVYTNEDEKLQYAQVNNEKIEFVDINDTKLSTYCSTNNITKGEVAVGYEEFAKNMCQNIKQFEFVTFDYGEKYPRNDFSCRVYEKHNVYPIFDEEIELKKLFGKTDITYDVNFSHVIKSFENEGAKNIIFETQLKALVNFGIIELLEILHKNVDEKTYISESNKVKTLLNPTGMGDRFKMACFRQEANVDL
ncbi:MAG: SAM-dependent methyltransferase [Campylobacterota bacterium]|nr:SAM-dependent methyltransferase [Campylobacterota bacterium]